MNETKEGLNAIGVIEEKSEATKKDGDVYWKFKIAIDSGELKGKTLTMSLWNLDTGKEVHTKERVKVFWSEKEGMGRNGPVTYRNINSIGPVAKYKQDPNLVGKTDADLAKDEKEVDKALGASATVPKPASFNDGARTGMLFNNAVALAISEGKCNKEQIENNYKYLKELLDVLER